MKGREIINRITREKMPDIEQVREACQTRPVQPRRGRKRLRLSVAAAFVAALVLFATAAYAIVDIVYQRVDTGSGWDIVILPDDEYGRQIYYERRAEWTYGHFIYFPLGHNMYIRHISAGGAQFINERLEGLLFTADGTPIDFELAMPMQGAFNRLAGRHHIDDRGYVLYTSDGHPIGAISLHSSMDGDLLDVSIQTEEDIKASFGFNSSYEEARAAFGDALRLPTAHIERFFPPCFDLHEWWPHLHQTHWALTVRYNIRELRGIGDWCQYEMRIFVETARGEYDGQRWTSYHLGGEAIAHDIAGVAVYELNLPDTAIHFIWVHDGLAYRLNPSPTFTRAQTMEVIRSMIE